jgi:hypothetical protein
LRKNEQNTSRKKKRVRRKKDSEGQQQAGGGVVTMKSDSDASRLQCCSASGSAHVRCRGRRCSKRLAEGKLWKRRGSKEWLWGINNRRGSRIRYEPRATLSIIYRTVD